jgi:hypothetical protein
MLGTDSLQVGEGLSLLLMILILILVCGPGLFRGL